jgi:hypothetical protein
MAEKALTTAEAEALSGTTDATSGVAFVTSGADPYLAAVYRTFHQLMKVAMLGNSLRVYADDSLATTVGVRAGRRTLGTAALVYAGGTVALASYNNSTANLWLYNNAGTPTVAAGASWPSYPHWKLASVALSAGAITSITDRRDEGSSDTVLPVYTTGGRPSASTAGRVIFNSTTSRLNIDTGSAWVLADGTSA